MKILASADIHGDLGLIRKLIETVKKENPDILILAGDIGFMLEPPTNFFYTLIKYIPPDRIFVVPGNHDSPDMLDFWKKMYGVKTLHGTFEKFKDFLIVGIGGGNLPPFFVSEDQIKYYVSKIKNYLDKNYKIILVSHTHPANTKSEVFAEGSKELLKFIKENKPLLVIHGHIHETGGLEDIIESTRVINAARNIVLIELKNNENTVVKKV